MLRLEPSRGEARRIVAGVQAFWLAAGVGFRLAAETPAFAPLFVAGFAAGLLFYWTVFVVAARELGRPVSSFWYPFPRHTPPGERRWRRRGTWPVLFRIIDPRWWHSVVAPATGWPVLAVDAVMVLGLVAVIASSFGGPAG